jgi:hypothetical protein
VELYGPFSIRVAVAKEFSISYQIMCLGKMKNSPYAPLDFGSLQMWYSKPDYHNYKTSEVFIRPGCVR